MVRELRELCLVVSWWSSAIEMPTEVAARDELIRRFVKAEIAPVAVQAKPPPDPDRYFRRDEADLPWYWE